MTVNDLMEDLEDETKYIMMDGKPVALKTIIDKILSEDRAEKRHISEG